jgi:hypothetical protein
MFQPSDSVWSIGEGAMDVPDVDGLAKLEKS